MRELDSQLNLGVGLGKIRTVVFGPSTLGSMDGLEDSHRSCRQGLADTGHRQDGGKDRGDKHNVLVCSLLGKIGVWDVEIKSWALLAFVSYLYRETSKTAKLHLSRAGSIGIVVTVYIESRMACQGCASLVAQPWRTYNYHISRDNSKGLYTRDKSVVREWVRNVAR